MAREIKTAARDGVSYVVEKVHHDGKCVGLAPSLQFAELDEMRDVFDDKVVFDLAIRQYRQDAKNKVRAKFLKSGVSAERIVSSLNNGSVKWADVAALAEREKIQPTEAAKRLIQASMKVEDANPDTIHWDIL